LLIPYFIFQSESLFKEFAGISDQYYQFNENLEILYILNILFLLFVFYFFDEGKNKFQISFFKYEIIKFIHIALILYLVFEIYNLIQWNFSYFTQESTNSNLVKYFNLKFIDGINTQLMLYRELVYSFFLGGRQTHIKILIILSVYLFKQNRKQALIGYLLIFFYDFLSMSRYNFFSLIVIHFLIYFKFEYLKNNIFKIIIVLIGILIFLNFRSFLIKPPIIEENYGDIRYILRNFFGEFNSVFISLSIFNVEFKKIFINIYLKHSYYSGYFLDNLNFLLNDFFYLNFPDRIDYWSNKNSPINDYSKFGSTYIIAYFFSFIVLIIFYKILRTFINFFYINDDFFIKITSAYILATSFRSNIVHEVGFVIKLIILILVLDLIFKYLRVIKN
tara:strand:- start:202 stop:1371 length:1170 start_codon:yes stop_codon:yes gene_type:complete